MASPKEGQGMSSVESEDVDELFMGERRWLRHPSPTDRPLCACRFRTLPKACMGVVFQASA